MLSIFVCEDNPEHLDYITECINEHLFKEDMPVEVVCSTNSPADVLEYLQNNNVAGLYFLDLDLGEKQINGIKLAEEVRKYDPRGFVVFITADAESHVLTFKFHVEAMDYIVKNDPNLDARILECLQNAYAKFMAKATPLQDNFVFKLRRGSEERIISIDCSKILYMEASPEHNIAVYTNESKHEFRGNLSKVQKNLNKSFFRCHRSYIVNIKKIIAIDTKLLLIKLENGVDISIASGNIKKVKKLIDASCTAS